MYKIREARKAARMTQRQVADCLCITPATYSRYESGIIKPDPRSLLKLSKLFGVSVDALLGAAEDGKEKAQGFKIPVLGKVVAGIPVEAVTDVLDYEEIPEAMARGGEFFALRIAGDSMAPRICDGDVVIVRKQEAVDDGDIAIVLVNGGEATIKEVRRSQFGLTLIGWNVAVYQPHFYTVDEVERLPVQVIGKVVELRGKFK